MAEVNIMGTEYDISIKNDMLEDDGRTDFYDKTIFVRSEEQMLDEHDIKYKKSSRSRHVQRHELIHAMLYECGLTEYAYDETIVEWIAHMFPKMKNLFEEVGCVDT